MNARGRKDIQLSGFSHQANDLEAYYVHSAAINSLAALNSKREPTPSIAAVGTHIGAHDAYESHLDMSPTYDRVSEVEDAEARRRRGRRTDRVIPLPPGPYIDTRLSRWVPMGNPWAPTHQIKWALTTRFYSLTSPT
ncbi:hypothetical protein R3P38DRAFT_3374087 [Favolaschia claudopus]|uniref:Uncharacterized protein n=1 Tax=Favolaschia claudopus TaxID=2862362 RepID=A0AAV9ZQ08_9AGAR